MTHICWARTVPGLTPNAHNVLNALAGAADDTALAYPSVPTLELWTSLSRPSVYRALTELEEAGLILRAKVKGQGNAYHLSLGDPSHTETRLTQRPVSHRDPSHTETKPVSHRDETRLTQRPKRYLKDLKGGDISPFPGVAVSGGKKANNDAAYKRQSAAWVEPSPATPPTPNPGRDIWESVKKTLENELPLGFLDHIRRATFEGMESDTVRIRAQNVFQQDAIERRLTPQLERELSKAAGRPIRLQVLYDVSHTVDA